MNHYFTTLDTIYTSRSLLNSHQTVVVGNYMQYIYSHSSALLNEQNLGQIPQHSLFKQYYKNQFQDTSSAMDQISCTTGDFREILKGNFQTYQAKKIQHQKDSEQTYYQPSHINLNAQYQTKNKQNACKASNFFTIFGKIQGQKAFALDSKYQFNPLQKFTIFKNVVSRNVRPLSGIGIKQMIFGGLFNCVLTYSGDLIVTGVTQPMKESFAHPIRRIQNVIHAAAGGRDLAFVTIDGDIGMILGSDPNEVTTINYPQQTTFKSVAVSLSHCFGLTENNQIFNWSTTTLKVYKVNRLQKVPAQNLQKDKEDYPKQEEKKPKKSRKPKYESLIDSDIEQSKQLKNKKELQFSSVKARVKKNWEVKQIVAGNNFVNVLYQNGQVYASSFTAQHQGQMQVQRLTQGGLKSKEITMIACSFVHSLALVRQDIPSIKQWDSQTLANWLANSQLDEISKIFRVKQISGFDLVQADQQFYADTLGIGGQSNLKKRLIFAVGEMMMPSVKKMELYGWGSNIFGQIGLAKGNLHQTPIQIPLPYELQQDDGDYIIGIACGKRNSAFWTKQGKSYIMGNCKIGASVQKLVQQKKDFEKQQKKQVHYGSKNKKKRSGQTVINFKKNQIYEIEGHYSKNEKVIQSLDQEEEKYVEEFSQLRHSWLDATAIMSQSKTNKFLKLTNIALGINQFVSICSAKQFPQDFQDEKQKKLIDAEKVLKKINAQPSKQKEYTVCYLDRFLGVLQSNIEGYLQSGIPYHRIRYFKKNGEIVWDRKKKISKIKSS